jgi:hypothetical protein
MPLMPGDVEHRAAVGAAIHGDGSLGAEWDRGIAEHRRLGPSRGSQRKSSANDGIERSAHGAGIDRDCGTFAAAVEAPVLERLC